MSDGIAAPASNLRPLATRWNYVAPPGRGGPRCWQPCPRRSACCARCRPEVGPASIPPAARPFPARGPDLVVAPALRLSRILALLPGAPHLLCPPIGPRAARPSRVRPRPRLFYREPPAAFPVAWLVSGVSFLPAFASPLPSPCGCLSPCCLHRKALAALRSVWTCVVVAKFLCPPTSYHRL